MANLLQKYCTQHKYFCTFLRLPMSKDANEFRSPNFCASQHGPNVALALFYVLLVGNPEHDAQPRPQLQSYVVCANMESLAVRVVDPGKEVGSLPAVQMRAATST